MPLAAAVKVTLLPAMIVWLVGCGVIAGATVAALTVSVTALLVAVTADLVATTV